MPIISLEEGIIKFQPKVIAAEPASEVEPVIFQQYFQRSGITIQLEDGSTIQFRFRMSDDLRDMAKKTYFEDKDGTKEAFLFPDTTEKEDRVREGYTVYEVFGWKDRLLENRVKSSFQGRRLTQLCFQQDQKTDCDYVILRNKNGIFRIAYTHGYLRTIQEIPAKGLGVAYEIGNPSVRERQEPFDIEDWEQLHPLQSSDVTMGINVEAYYERRIGKVVYLGEKIKSRE